MLVQRAPILMALCALFAVAGCDGGGGGGGEGGDDNDNDDTSSEPATECPPDQPGEQDACQPGLACSYMRDVAFCAAPIETKSCTWRNAWVRRGGARIVPTRHPVTA